MLAKPERPRNARRVRRALGLFLSIALAAPAASAARRAAPRAPSVCDTELPLGVLFRFHAGAPTTPPVRGPEGAFYVGTIDGQVHALHPDGSFHWNFTVKGAVTGRLLVERSGVVLVPATQHIFALNPDGTLAWRAPMPVEIQGDLVRDGRGHVHVAGADGRLFALGERGTRVTEIAVDAPWSALPTALPDGSVVAASVSGLVVVSAPSGVRRFALELAPRQILLCPGERSCAVAGNTLRSLTGRPELRLRARSAAAAGAFLALLVDDRTLAFYDGARTAARYAVHLPSRASAPPVLDAQGTAYVPLVNGAVVAVSRSGRVLGCEQIGRGATAVALDASGLVLAATSEGNVAVIEPRS